MSKYDRVLFGFTIVTIVVAFGVYLIDADSKRSTYTPYVKCTYPVHYEGYLEKYVIKNNVLYYPTMEQPTLTCQSYDAFFTKENLKKTKGE